MPALEALDHHGTPLGVLVRDLTADQSKPSWTEIGDPDAVPLRGTSPPPFSEKRKLTPQTPTKTEMTVHVGDGQKPFRVRVHGGYTDGKDDILLVRTRTKRGIHDCLIWVVAGEKWRPEADIPKDSLVPSYLWGMFLLNPEGNKLMIEDGTRWSKMFKADLERYDGRVLKPMFRSKGSSDTRRRGG